ncbi:MAG: hypothetical protein JWO15_1366 [Sphingomonadales bacterium]|nr:hypothetical protein [Sphingomonadales bacterium]
MMLAIDGEDWLELHNLLMTYARGADRADEAIMRSAFHDGAVMETGFVATAIDEYVPAILHRTRTLYKTMFHSVSNERFEVRGSRAWGEAYVTVFALTREKAPHEVTSGGRYLDHFERRAGLWKFVHRRYVHDWKSIRAAATALPPSADASLGGFGVDDPSVRFWADAHDVE